MDLMTFVKVGNVSNLSDARYCAGFGVNMIGFNLDEAQDDSITIEMAREIMGWVAGVDFVMEYGDMSLDQIKSIHDEENPAYIQVNDLMIANQLAELSFKVIYKHVCKNVTDLKTIQGLSEKTHYLLIESDLKETELQEALQRNNINHKTLNGSYHNPVDVATQVKDSFYFGIALNGSHEEKPGFKDYDELADILECLEADV